MDTKFYYNNEKSPKINSDPTIGCVAIIVRDDKFLLEKRADSERWAFIGGGLENDECFETCVIREVLEETGLIVKKVELWDTFSDPSRIIQYKDGITKRVITIAFLTTVINYDVMRKSEESKELRFFSLDALQSIKFAETHIPIKDEILKRYEKK